VIGIVQDPQDPNKLVLTATVTIYLDRLLSDVLAEEVSKAIREKAIQDLQHSPAVKKAIATAAQKLLLEMLGVKPEEK
jgi:hypothetical protein